MIKKIEFNSNLKTSISEKKITLSNLEDFLNGIITGKNDNKYDTEKGYQKTIYDDKKSLETEKIFGRGNRKQKLKDIIDEAEHIVLGFLFPFEDEQPNIIDMPKLEIEESAEQKGQGLKILTAKQLIARLPILLAQLKPENNSQKLKNEIRLLLYSLYRSKNLSKTIYNNLINAI